MMSFPPERKEMTQEGLNILLYLLEDAELTPTQERICLYLTKEAACGYDRIIPASELYRKLWETDIFFPADGVSIRGYISGIRRKLHRKKGEPGYIMACTDPPRQVNGYRMVIDSKEEEERYKPYKGELRPDEIEGLVLTSGGELWVFPEDSQRITIPGFVKTLYDTMSIFCHRYGNLISREELLFFGDLPIPTNLLDFSYARANVHNIRNLFEEYNVSQDLIVTYPEEGYILNCKQTQVGLDSGEPTTEIPITEQELRLARSLKEENFTPEQISTITKLVRKFGSL